MRLQHKLHITRWTLLSQNGRQAHAEYASGEGLDAAPPCRDELRLMQAFGNCAQLTPASAWALTGVPETAALTLMEKLLRSAHCVRLHHHQEDPHTATFVGTGLRSRPASRHEGVVHADYAVASVFNPYKGGSAERACPPDVTYGAGTQWRQRHRTERGLGQLPAMDRAAPHLHLMNALFARP